MKYRVRITQTLEGFAEIEASSPQDAILKADKAYNAEGHELPDMLDSSPLSFSVESILLKDRDPQTAGEHPSYAEIESYLKRRGRPHPTESDILEFMDGGDRQAHYDEAVRNNYSFFDLDRWFHLMDILHTDISFRAAMMLENALWEEDLDALEANTYQDLLDTKAGILKDRMAYLMKLLSETGDVSGNPWRVTAEDVTTLVSVLKLEPQQDIVNPLENAPGLKKPEAKVFICSAGGVKQPIYEGSYQECEEFCESLKWEFKDENDFVWDLELEDLREQEKAPAQAHPSLAEQIRAADARLSPSNNPNDKTRETGPTL